METGWGAWQMMFHGNSTQYWFGIISWVFVSLHCRSWQWILTLGSGYFMLKYPSIMCCVGFLGFCGSLSLSLSCFPVPNGLVYISKLTHQPQCHRMLVQPPSNCLEPQRIAVPSRWADGASLICYDHLLSFWSGDFFQVFPLGYFSEMLMCFLLVTHSFPTTVHVGENF